jgi:diguanylate cyclase (GGDEF)-like protein
MFRLKGKMQDMISACIIKTNNEQANTYQQETWFLPLISRDMMANMDDCREFYGAAMKKLAALKADSTFLFLFEEPIRHRASDNWVCPQKMYLAAAQVGDQVYSYEEDERPMLTPEEGIQPFFHETNGRQMSIFCLFSEEIQYGFMMTEIAPANLALSYLISMQIANALKFYEVSREQKRTQRKLEKLVTEVNEKNEVLNFISEYDVLTGFLNRRGFMERIMQYNKEHNGEEALMIYADLDHLKEINDCFGHNEGDFAIRSASKMLQQILGEGCIIGRLGGDEFAALCPPCDQEERSRVTMKAKDILWQFNETSGKEYYVEITIGWHSFGCDPGNVFTEILDAADKKLYEAKRRRRPTVVKHPVE